MRIAQLELQNVGVFEHQVIDFKPKTDPDKAEIHILTGVNGTGKSTILYSLAGSVFNPEIVQSRFRTDSLTNRVTVVFSNSSATPTTITVAQNRNEGISHKSDTIWLKAYQDILRLAYPVLIQRSISFAIFAYSGHRTLSTIGINALPELTDNPLLVALDFQHAMDPRTLLQWIANTKAKIAFARQEANHQHAERYEVSLRRIEQAIREIVGYSVEFAFSYEPFAIRVKVRDQELEFDVLPDGLKSIISWK